MLENNFSKTKFCFWLALVLCLSTFSIYKMRLEILFPFFVVASTGAFILFIGFLVNGILLSIKNKRFSKGIPEKNPNDWITEFIPQDIQTRK